MQITWQYLAGFFDGEGSISLTQNKSRPNTANYNCIFTQGVDNGAECLFADIQGFLRERGCKSYVQKRGKTRNRFTNKDIFALQIMSRPSCKIFLEGVLPYLRVKKTKCQDILRYMNLFPPLPKYYCMIRNEQYRKTGSYAF